MFKFPYLFPLNFTYVFSWRWQIFRHCASHPFNRSPYFSPNNKMNFVGSISRCRFVFFQFFFSLGILNKFAINSVLLIKSRNRSFFLKHFFL
jgi:hypothetical protein